MGVSADPPKMIETLMGMAGKQISALGQYDNYGAEVRKTLYLENPVTIFK